MHETTYQKLRPFGIRCLNDGYEDVRLGFGARKTPMLFEPCLEFRQGTIDADEIGAFTYMGGAGALFRHVARVGRFCAFAGAIQTGHVEHPTHTLSPHAMFYGDWSRTWPMAELYYRDNAAEFARARSAERAFGRRFGKIAIGNDVWIGYGAFIRRGVTIGDGAVIAARAVVTRDVPPYAIVAGTPARPVRERFPREVIDRLLRLRWWDYGLAALRGVDVSDMPQCLDRIERNVAGLPRWRPARVAVHPDGRVEPAPPAD